jgi:hypothetical protein
MLLGGADYYRPPGIVQTKNVPRYKQEIMYPGPARAGTNKKCKQIGAAAPR